MGNRQTISQPEVPGIQYSLLEQVQDENKYRFSGRDATTGELITILGSAEEINTEIGAQVIDHTSQPEKLKTKEEIMEERAQVCAQQVSDIFVKIKSENKLASSIDIYRDTSGREVITALVDGATGLDAPRLFELLSKELGLKGIAFSRPSYGYFVNKSHSSSVRFNVFYKENDPIAQQEIEKRSSICAERLKEIFIQLRNENQLQEIFSLESNTEGRKALKSLIEGVSNPDEKNLRSLFDTLDKKLKEMGIDASHSSAQYFLDLNKGGVPPYFNLSIVKENTKKVHETNLN